MYIGIAVASRQSTVVMCVSFFFWECPLKYSYVWYGGYDFKSRIVILTDSITI